MMTIEEKAKRYDEAIKKAKSKIKDDKDHVLYEDDVIEIFPELKGSENITNQDCNYKTYTELVKRLEKVKDAVKKQNYGIAMDILFTPYPGFQVMVPTDWSEKYIADVFEMVGLAKIVREQENDALTEALQSAMIELAKYRVVPQIRQEWSEEDKKLIDDTCHLINTLASGYGEKVTEPITFSGTQMIASIKDRLRALVDNRPQSQWKPSDGQMEALRYVTNFDYGGHKATLVSLYEQLKKLKA
jgi:hypothetical protein